MPGAFPVAAPLPPQGREDERRADEENTPAAAPGPARVRPVRPTHHPHRSPPRLSPPTRLPLYSGSRASSGRQAKNERTQSDFFLRFDWLEIFRSWGPQIANSEILYAQTVSLYRPRTKLGSPRYTDRYLAEPRNDSHCTKRLHVVARRYIHSSQHGFRLRLHGGRAPHRGASQPRCFRRGRGFARPQSSPGSDSE